MKITVGQLTAVLKCCGELRYSRWAPTPASTASMVMAVGSMEAESTATTGSPSTACKHVINDHINFYQSQDKTLIAETNDGIKG